MSDGFMHIRLGLNSTNEKYVYSSGKKMFAGQVQLLCKKKNTNATSFSSINLPTHIIVHTHRNFIANPIYTSYATTIEAIQLSNSNTHHTHVNKVVYDT